MSDAISKNEAHVEVPSKKSAGIPKGLLYVGAVVAILAVVGIRNGYHLGTSLVTASILFKLGLNGFFGLGVIFHETLSSHPVTNYVDIGLVKSFQMKFLYFCRYQFNDNFLWEDWHNKLSDEIIAELEAKGAPKDGDQVHEIPNFDFKDMDPKTFFFKYVQPGRPVILRNVPIKAMQWTPKYIAEVAGNFTTPMRCGPQNKVMSVSEYVASAKNPKSTKCYLDNNADIFTAYPNLENDLELWKFSEYAMNMPAPAGAKPPGCYFAQLFMGLFPALGVTYHCANYNNLFFMIHGRKKWTFIDPSNSWFVYPTFRRMMRDSISRITWHAVHAPNSSEIIAKHFPLFRYAPKYEFTLEPGDMLVNPPWNWHMVENLDTESIGIATRWSMPAIYPYTNALFSFNHFTSFTFWKFVYDKVAFQLKVTDKAPYNPTAHLQFDGNVNFGRKGSMLKYQSMYQDILTPDVWEQYLDWLKKEGEADGIDYMNRQ